MKILYWLRNDLRLHDNEALAALPAHTEALLPVYCFDPATLGPDRYLGLPRLGPHRLPFLLETLADLQRQYAALGSGIHFVVGSPTTELPRLASELGLNTVWASAEHPHEETTAETDLAAALGRGVPLRFFETLSLLHPHDLPIPVRQLPLSFSKFRFDAAVGTPVRPPLPAPRQLPPLPAGVVPAPLPEAAVIAKSIGLSANVLARDARSALPALGGGETAALARLHDYAVDRRLIARYNDTRNEMLGEAFSTKFSPWLANGSLSARQIWAAIDAYEAVAGRNGKGSQQLRLELIWRDYFRLLARRAGADFFRLAGLRGQLPKTPNPDRAAFDRWTQGRTGNGFVDANMRELAATGFMSNRGRQNAASYLIHDLHQDWRWGAAWFEHQLIDHDPASNWGNWKYIAGTGTDVRDTAFDVAQQAKRYDPKGSYVRTWMR
ncbi:DASH family cryptochrome [Hymenobacter arizonensis]|uniref:Cryptochrome DASH n=1 Tax=Hymenobacter arizonensis TaxID=1227077 RepID=A0A1I5WXD4_HYMAR|nr:DASH family cryptochrome [Hymenobacter arizonensis]SFQ24196.1 deoxyribodipyrimidine photo-lyase (single-stranded DNA-specific) [Hymenobacter arizonensis]